MLVLDGREVSKVSRASLLPRIETFIKKVGRAPHLTVVIVGDDPASHVYVKNKQLACEKIGLSSTVHRLPVGTTQNELHELLQTLNNEDSVDGILVQLPLPKHLKTEEVLKQVAVEKDADGLTFLSLGYFFAGKPLVSPCTPAGVMEILKFYKIDVAGKKAVVVGRSNIVGKPMAIMLSEANATVTVCHSKTPDVSAVTREADIVVVAAGKAHLLGKESFKKDAVVIDVGMHGSGGGKLMGDVRFDELKDWVKAASPVPGGVGPMTITMLLKNTCLLAELRKGVV
jgi:methylenetetrahydrofolate dehydrogenase (NADP+)/methenyltetrahydrofolate cyclohydrolase